MRFSELSEAERNELRVNYLHEFTDENSSPSWLDIAQADEVVTDEMLEEAYGHIHFVRDDFFCNEQEDYEDGERL